MRDAHLDVGARVRVGNEAVKGVVRNQGVRGRHANEAGHEAMRENALSVVADDSVADRRLAARRTRVNPDVGEVGDLGVLDDQLRADVEIAMPVSPP